MSIFVEIQECTLQARKDKHREMANFLGTFLNDMRNHITGGVSASIYGVYSPEDKEVVAFLKSQIKSLSKGVETVRGQTTESAMNYIQDTNLKITTLEVFLPRQLEVDELKAIIINIVDSSTLEVGSKKLMGYVMGELKKSHEGLFDATLVRTILQDTFGL